MANFLQIQTYTMPISQRSFFRIDVMLPCSYRIISATEADQHPLPTNPDAGYIEKYFMDNIEELDHQIDSLIKQIGERSQITAAVLTALNSKINFLMQTLDEKQLTHSIPQKMVNLSAGGIALHIPEPINQNNKVDILIRPLRDESPILLRCKVVSIQPQDDGNFVALEFENLTENNRRKLVYFIQNKEIEHVNAMRNK